MTDDRDEGAAHSFGNAEGGARGFNTSHFVTFVASSVVTAMLVKWLDHSDTTATQIATAAGMARVETEITSLKLEVDRLLERPIELSADHARDIDDLKSVESRDVQRLEGRLDQLEQPSHGRR